VVGVVGPWGMGLESGPISIENIIPVPGVVLIRGVEIPLISQGRSAAGSCWSKARLAGPLRFAASASAEQCASQQANGE